MAKQFIYDSVGFAEATATAGISGSSPLYLFLESSTLDGTESYANDSSLSRAVTSFYTADTIRYDLGSSQTANVIALYFTGTETDNLDIYVNTVSNAIGSTPVLSITDTFTSGWNIFDLSGTGQYWYLVSNNSYISNLTEVIIGTKYEFDVEPDIGNTLGEEYGTDIMTSYGGQEYANKRHEPKTTWDWNWSFVTASMKTSLESLNSSVQDHKKFVYYDETSYNYVRMTKPMAFNEVAYNVFSTSISLKEQLS
jgi:hypothetical protein